MGRAFEVRKAAMAKTSLAKSKIYSRYGKEIYVAAKSGEADPEMNSALKRIVEKAKANQVPADVIKRAIEKAKGGADESYSSVMYEIFGPGASTLLVECLTDNTNRSISDVRGCLNKAQGKLGVSGSVNHSYDNLGLLSFDYDDYDGILEVLLEQDCDVKELELEDGIISIYCEPTDLYKCKDAVETLVSDCEFSVLEITYLAQNYVELNTDDKEIFERLLALLDDVDDVQNVYHNVTI